MEPRDYDFGLVKIKAIHTPSFDDWKGNASPEFWTLYASDSEGEGVEETKTFDDDPEQAAKAFAQKVEDWLTVVKAQDDEYDPFKEDEMEVVE